MLINGVHKVDQNSWGKEDVFLGEEAELDICGTNPLQVILRNEENALQRRLYYFVQPGIQDLSATLRLRVK